jgi:hypothetical protein
MAEKLINHFVVFLDRSGSMQPIQRQAVDAFNMNATAIREGAEKSDQEATVTLVTFGGDIKEEYFCQNAKTLKTYDYQEYQPSGGTPLFDAVGKTVKKLLQRPDVEDKNVSFMLVIITDGEENASFEFNDSAVLNNLIHEVQKTDRWSFAFLLPPGHAKRFCATFSIPDGNVKEWALTARGLQDASQAVSTGISSYYTHRSSGKSSVKDFFVTDLSKISPTTIQKTLEDIRSKVNIWQVPRECEIRIFCEEKSKQTYKKGNAFYQLMKTETVQSYKQIILIEKGKDAVYAGEDARKILGLPAGNVKVKPGNHANWDIFVQSTSVNRKLVRGTSVVYLK